MRVVGIIANIMPRDNPGPGLRWMRQHSAPNSNVVHSGSGIAGVKSPIAVLTTEQLREPEGKHDADQFERDFFRGARRRDDLSVSCSSARTTLPRADDSRELCGSVAGLRNHQLS
jgi:hypothetical protein